jgi:hypothetical protein
MNQTPEVGRVLRSDYCPECNRIGCCGGEQDCAAYRRHVAAALERGLELAFRRYSHAAAALLKQ